MTILRLNEEGVAVFSQFIDRLTTDSPMAFPAELLTAGEYAYPIGGSCAVLDKLDLDDKFATAEAIDQLISELSISSPERDAGFWTWLSCYLFENLCPRDKYRAYVPGERARWVADTSNYQRYYRHMLAGIWGVYRAHSDDPQRAIALLNGPVNKRGDLFEQVASRKEQVTNNAVVELTRALYWDEQKSAMKRGSGGKGPGSPRRLADILWQFDRTWDLYEMTTQGLIQKLPPEFDRFSGIERQGV